MSSGYERYRKKLFLLFLYENKLSIVIYNRYKMWSEDVAFNNKFIAKKSLKLYLNLSWFKLCTISPKKQAIYSIRYLQSMKRHLQAAILIACENIHFSSLFAAGDVLRWGTSATQRQKFHTDDANQCLLNKSGSHGVPNVNLFNFRFLLVDFGKVFCSSANELQQNSNACSTEDYIPQILTVLLAFCLLSVIRKQQLKQYKTTPLTNQGFWPGFWTYFTSSVWNFCGWVADVPPRETSLAAKSVEKRMFSKATILKGHFGLGTHLKTSSLDFPFSWLVFVLGFNNKLYNLFFRFHVFHVIFIKIMAKNKELIFLAQGTHQYSIIAI